MFLDRVQFQFLCASSLVAGCLYLADIAPALTSQPELLETYPVGWIPGLINAFNHILPVDWLASALLATFISITAILALKLFPASTLTKSNRTIKSVLILTNPLVLWCAGSTETLLLPLLSVLLWRSFSRLQTETFFRSSTAAGLMIALFLSANTDTLAYGPALFLGALVLLPFRLRAQDTIPALGILAAPTVFLLAGTAYWYWTTTSNWPLSLQPAYQIAEMTHWQERHQANFGTALGELLVWSIFLVPTVCWQVLRARQPSRRRFAVFVFTIPLATAALATEYSALATPLTCLVTLVMGQAVVISMHNPRYALASLYISWLGSFSALWYYAL